MGPVPSHKQSYGDAGAVPLSATSFASGGLRRDSFVRPGKLFTASEAIVLRVAGSLTAAAHRSIVASVVKLVESSVE